jgi:hypothetical protein
MKALTFPALSILAGVWLLASASAAPAQTAAKSGASMAPPAAAHPEPARGIIKAVSDTRLVLDTHEHGSGPDTLFLDEHTVVQRLGKTLTIKDLKVGAPVTVSYVLKDGKPVATRVWVRFARTGVPAATAPAKAR